MKTKSIVLFVAVLCLSACTPSKPPEPTIDIAAVKTSAVATAMASIPTETRTSTATFTPTLTSTPAFTATQIYTATVTATTVPLTAFLSLTFADGLRTSPNNYVGKHIKALAYKVGSLLDSWPANTYFLYGSNFGPRGAEAKLTKSPDADNSAEGLDTKDHIWIYGLITKTDDDLASISVFHIETIPADQQPRGDGVYTVNEDIAPGRWKSTEDATTAQSCYWARIADGGATIDNYFGYGGTTVFISKSDFAVEFKECGEMVYLGK